MTTFGFACNFPVVLGNGSRATAALSALKTRKPTAFIREMRKLGATRVAVGDVVVEFAEPVATVEQLKLAFDRDSEPKETRLAQVEREAAEDLRMTLASTDEALSA